MLPGIIALVVASLVLLLSVTRCFGEDGIDEQRPISSVASSAMRVAYYAWGAYANQWSPGDAIFLVYFAQCIDIFTCAIFAPCSKKRAILVGMISFAAATLGCFALLETDIAACCAIAISLVVLANNARDDSEETHPTPRAVLLLLLLAGRIATARAAFLTGIIIDCSSMFVACYSILLDLVSEND